MVRGKWYCRAMTDGFGMFVTNRSRAVTVHDWIQSNAPKRNLTVTSKTLLQTQRFKDTHAHKTNSTTLASINIHPIAKYMRQGINISKHQRRKSKLITMAHRQVETTSIHSSTYHTGWIRISRTALGKSSLTTTLKERMSMIMSCLVPIWT